MEPRPPPSGGRDRGDVPARPCALVQRVNGWFPADQRGWIDVEYTAGVVLATSEAGGVIVDLG
jgi:hypothetical protein